ncbi:FAD-dependent monooxygenase [Ruania zhangjianzhongii]|uniref:FAD-dependent monooxygenase n=1 Tax=Ruania zhangjianzhongii TaxID=2603206 RepID=UPI0011C825C4|nr:FAD-dependent monooxygenase [Ruania zhangjianzhongii]
MTGKIIVIGGGIGGLCAAIALRRAGIQVVVYEQAEQFSEIGAGIQVWVKGMQALRLLGVADAVRAAGAEVHQHQFFNADGVPLYSADLAALARDTGAPAPVMIARSALIDALATGIDADESVRFGHRVSAVQQSDDKVRVEFAGGGSDEADLVVAADGINSTVRRLLFPAARIRTASYRYVRSLVEHPAPFGNKVFAMFFGRGNRIAVGDCGDGALYWLVGLKRPTVDLGGAPEVLKADLLRRFETFPEGIGSVIEATPADSLIHHTVRDLQPIETWGRGRVFLLGDAAHATTPNLGRGSGVAMADAVVLADLLGATDLTDAGQLATVLEAYSRSRTPEAHALQRTSWRIGNITSWDNAVMTHARDLMMRTVVGRRQVAEIGEQFVQAAALQPPGQRWGNVA